MDIFMKSALCLTAAVCTSMAFAADVFKLENLSEISKHANVSQQDQIFTVRKNATLLSNRTLTLDPAKKYRLSGEFRCIQGKSPNVYLGYAPRDAKNRQIRPACVLSQKDSLTELAENVKAGDKVLKIKDASKWDTVFPYTNIVFNAKDDLSDLPNFEVFPIEKDSIKKVGDVWEITLKDAARKAYPAGTKVRQQKDGATYIYTASAGPVKQEWTARTGVISGEVLKEMNSTTTSKLWPGTKSVQVLVMFLGGTPDSVVEFRNIKVEEVQ